MRLHAPHPNLTYSHGREHLVLLRRLRQRRQDFYIQAPQIRMPLGIDELEEQLKRRGHLGKRDALSRGKGFAWGKGASVGFEISAVDVEEDGVGREEGDVGVGGMDCGVVGLSSY